MHTKIFAAKVGLPYNGDMARRTYTAVYKQAENGWIAAWIKELPGVVTQGRSMQEAEENLADAFSLMLEVDPDLLSKDRRLVRRKKQLSRK
ncbi:MAG TPA: type II toxin-antitoxin system HicB family antitoxin [Candidatus Paceibacterota bacterium]|nr:type II toxin-antitoxin system HicB family antitoxin [Candidatus Paceibacterota bacterium]